MSYLHDLRSSVCQVALTQVNVTTTVTGPVMDMIAGDGTCNLLRFTLNANQTYNVANVLQSAASTGNFVAISGVTMAATTQGVPPPLVFNRDQRYLCVRYDFAGTGATGNADYIIEQKKVV